MKSNFSPIFAVLISLVLVAFLLVAGCTQTGTTQTQTTTPATTAPTEQATAATETQTASETPDSSDEFVVATAFNGTGDADITANLKGGIVRVLKFTQPKYSESSVTVRTGNAIFVFENVLTKEAETSNADAKNVDESVADAKYIWSQAFFVPQDIATSFKVTATDSWQADVDVPLAINSIPPVTFRGIGDFATPFFQINSGDYVINATLEDADKISMSLISFDGNIYTLDTPEIKNDKILIPFTVDESNNYLVNVACNGNWEFVLSQASN